jgi:hypothetical protein
MHLTAAARDRTAWTGASHMPGTAALVARSVERGWAPTPRWQPGRANIAEGAESHGTTVSLLVT